MVLVALIIFGGIYGFALYVRDAVRAVRRYQATGELRMWPEPMTWEDHDETIEHAPPRPDVRDEDRWWDR